jgi:hypothetical protein
MSSDYLLKIKSENDCIGAYIKEINQNYSKMKEETLFYLIDTSISTNTDYSQYNKDINEINELLNNQNDHIKQIMLFNEKVRQKIVSLCKHEWIKDTIDIDLDRSKTIEYCKICEFSK